MSNETSYPDAPPNLVDLINKLIEPSEPVPISMMPETGGWLVLGAILGAILGAVAIYGFLRYRAHAARNAYRKAALIALDAAGDDPKAIAVILRRTALAAFPRAQVASLSGSDWLAFLDRSAGTDDFSRGAGKILATAPYTGANGADPATCKAAKNWVRHHKSEAEI